MLGKQRASETGRNFWQKINKNPHSPLIIARWTRNWAKFRVNTV
jgi:hypothetical protein